MGKHKSKFNLIDLLIVSFLLLVLIFTTHLFIIRENVFVDNLHDAEYEIYISSIPDEFVNNISVGDSVYEQISVIPIGTVKDVIIEHKNEETSQLTLILMSKAKKLYGVLNVNGFEIREGSTIDFRTTNLAYSGILRNIQVNTSQGE